MTERLNYAELNRQFKENNFVLVKGILEKDVEVTTISDKMVVENKGGYRQAYHKPYWHTTKEEAIAHAEELRTRRIASLKKQIVSVEKLKF